MRAALLPLALLTSGLLPAGPVRAQVLLRTQVSPDEDSVSYRRFGHALARTGDLNGDGVTDFLVGELRNAVKPPDVSGRAYALSGADGSTIHAFASPNEEPADQFGASVAGVPDTDGDRVDDLLIGAYGETVDGSEYKGRAYLFSGATGVLLHTLQAPSCTILDCFGFGLAVAGVPDTDGDGRGDLLVRNNNLYGLGAAYLYSGRTGALRYGVDSPSFSGDDDAFGVSLAGMNDLDGDGRGDFAAGAPDEFLEGNAYVFSGRTGALLHFIDEPGVDELGLFGWSVMGVDDADGDGVDDFLVGDPRHREVEFDAGRAYLFSGATGAFIRVLESPAPQGGAQVGYAVAGVEDVDGDEHGDHLVGSGYGRAHVFSGSTGALLHTFGPPSPRAAYYGSDFDQAAAGIGDLDEDGRGDFVVSGGGKVYVFSGASPAILAVTASVLDTTVPGGDSLRVRVVLTNNTTEPLTGDLRLNVADSDYSHPETALPLISDATIGAGRRARPVFAVAVPVNAPLGTYTGVVVAEDSTGRSAYSAPFSFVVTGDVLGARGGARVERLGLGPAELVEAGGLLVGAAPVAAGVLADAHAQAVVGPNPASGRTTIAFALAAPTDVRLALYDVLGREVASVDAGTLPPGAHRLSLDVSALPSGVYVWRLAAGARMETGRLTVAR